ncbi:DUF5686 family protein [Melioribacter sp. OK-6-Me]|uniref:DUF5686 and carboxypeptidase-like regulatory domain-containing protein n=1 Tax=unclassified Melioribacter TaxID=2627329 RepID=UPI003ED8B759
MIKLFFITLLIFPLLIFSQQYNITGKITDEENNALPYSNLRIEGTLRGTSANEDGNYFLKLDKGRYKFIVSFIGYKSDTALIDLNRDTTVNFRLTRSAIVLEQVTVLPVENPALALMTKAIEYKKIRKQILDSYEYHAFTKILIKTNQDLEATDKSLGISTSENSEDLKITGIIENESKGYFRKPDNFKEIILARKQTANTPSEINIITGARLLKDFYREEIDFFNRPLKSPLADDALDYYYFIISDTLTRDNTAIFEVTFEPRDTTDKGFKGILLIADKTFALAGLKVHVNKYGFPGGFLDSISVSQQFYPYEDVYMPIDYRLSVGGNIFNAIKFAFDVNTIFFDYCINDKIDLNFDYATIKVLPEADSRDSLYWFSVQTIPYSITELEAYRRIDSLSGIEKTFWDNFSLLSPRLNIWRNLSVNGPLTLYSFNKVSGHLVSLNVMLEKALNRRLNSEFEISYGFNDRKTNVGLSAEYQFGTYRTGFVGFKAYDKLYELFGDAISYNKFTSTISSLFYKYDFMDYYYSKGIELYFGGDLLPFMNLSGGIVLRTDKSSVNNSDFSFFYRDRKFSANKQIFDGNINGFKFGINLDFRKYIEDGYTRRRINNDKGYLLLNGEIFSSNKDLLNSSIEFSTYKVDMKGGTRTFGAAEFQFIAEFFYSKGAVPIQMLHSLSGNINSAGKSFSFRTIRPGEVYGDRCLAIFTEHDFKDELFSLIPFMKNSRLIFTLHLNAALINLSEKSRQIMNNEPKLFIHPFIEAGFGIGHLISPFVLEFTWKLNQLDGNNFVIGLNSFIF